MEVQENSVTVAEYVYDGDGNQVQAVMTDGDLTITTVLSGPTTNKRPPWMRA